MSRNNQFVQQIYFCDLNLESIPYEIFDFVWLKKIDFSDNNIVEIPENIINLTNLESLILKNNSIKSIPKELAFLPSLKHLDLSHNPLVEPPIEVVNQGLAAIQNYFLELETESTKVYEAKLLIVGEGFVGKTTVMHRLVYNEYNREITSTEGIEIKRLNLKIEEIDDFKINIWDFGGQEIYHATHQFFITKRSLYILIWDATKEDHYSSFDYWLNIIKLLSSSSPVIIVQNKIDNRIKNLDEQSLIQTFPNIVGFYNVSAKTNDGFSKLIEGIKNEVFKLEHIGDSLPKAWGDIRQELESLKNNYIQLTDYYKICEKYNLNEESAMFLSQYYHDLGVFLHFQNNHILKEILFLKPEWATNAVYSLTDQNELISNFGHFKFEDLNTFWNNYPRDKYIHLLELMKRFELCFELESSENYIIPELLPETTPNLIWVNDINDLQFEYHYQFMPKAIITRFIVRNHYLICNNFCWKNGVIIEYESSKALLQKSPLEKTIKIKISGPNKLQLLSIIRKDIDYIHRTLNNPIVKEMIPCQCDECIQSNEPHLFDYNVLRKFQSKNKSTIECLKSIKNVQINKLIGDYTPNDDESELLKEIYEMIKVMYSKSIDTKTIKNRLNNYIMLQPNLMGLGINLNKIIEDIIGEKTSNKSRLAQ